MVKPSSLEIEEGPLNIGSWLTLYQGDGPPVIAIRCFEPKPKRAKDIKKGDVIPGNGSPGRVLDDPDPPDVEGEVFINIYNIFGDETTLFITDDAEEITICTTRRQRYVVVCFSFPALELRQNCLPV